jgi:hypothetical protein
MLAVSLSWIALYTLTPAVDRALCGQVDRQQCAATAAADGGAGTLYACGTRS